MARLAGSPILSGAPSGRHLFAKLVELLPPEPKSPEPLFLNFQGIEVATASFLRESVLAFRTFVRGRKSNFYPAIANANSEIIDELFEVVHLRGDVLMTCTVDENGEVLRCLRVGSLDPMQQITFDLVNTHGETTAIKLSETENSSIKPTAWNNRLSSLSSLGLISEKNQGRTKIYQPIFHGGCNGS